MTMICKKPIIALIGLFFVSPIAANMHMKVFNVGQGNCVVVIAQPEPTLLVDAGSSKHPRNFMTGKSQKESQIENIINYIIEHTVNKQLVAVISHPDKDHYNWLPMILRPLLQQNFAVKCILGGWRDQYMLEFENALSDFKKKFPDNYTETSVATCQGDLNQLNQLVPGYCAVLSALLKSKEDKDKNNNSIVLRTESDEFSAIIPGDATGLVTNMILEAHENLKTDILVLSHHGASSNRSNDKQWILKVDPSVVLISAGLHEGYRHGRYKTLRVVIEHLQKKPQVEPHLLTFCKDAGETLEVTSRFKPCLEYRDGFSTAVTDCPVYSTQDMGNISLSGDLFSIFIAGDIPQAQAASFKACAFQAFQGIRFNTIIVISLNGYDLDDSDIKNLAILPKLLEKLDVQNNAIGTEGLLQLLEALHRPEQFSLLEFSNNKPINFEQLQRAFEKNDAIKELATQRHVDVMVDTTNKTKSLEKVQLSPKSPVKKSPRWYLNNKVVSPTIIRKAD